MGDRDALSVMCTPAIGWCVTESVAMPSIPDCWAAAWKGGCGHD
jgi:hypothetical protein